MPAIKGKPSWNAGTAKPYMNNRGYMCRKVNGREYKEHRLIMESHLGRKLATSEHVHHIDGNKSNNEISNLKVVSAEDHMKEHVGNQRSDQAKRTMSIYREMKNELERTKRLNSEMLEALKNLVDELPERFSNEIHEIEKIIAKAEGTKE